MMSKGERQQVGKRLWFALADDFERSNCCFEELYEHIQEAYRALAATMCENDLKEIEWKMDQGRKAGWKRDAARDHEPTGDGDSK